MSTDSSPRDSHPSAVIRNPIDPRNPLARVYLTVMLFDLAEGALRFLVPIYLNGRGYGPGLIGVAASAFAIASLASRLPAGLAYQPGRARGLILGAGAASTLAFVAAPFTDSYLLFTLLMAIDGLGWGIATTSLLTLMMTTKPDEMSSASAMGWYVGFNGIGLALASTTGGLLGQLFGVRSAMLTLAVIPFVASVLICWRLPAVATSAEEARQDPRETRSEAGRSARASRALISLPPAVWAAALTAMYLNVMNNILNSFFPLIGLALGFSLAQVGSLAGVRSGVSALSRFAAGALFERVPARRLHVPLMITSAVTTAAVPSIPSYIVQMPVWAANGASRGLLRVTSGAEAMEATPTGREGLTAGITSAGLDVGKISGPLIGGVVGEAIGIGNMFRVVPLAFLVAFLVAEVAVRRRTRQPDLLRV